MAMKCSFSKKINHKTNDPHLNFNTYWHSVKIAIIYTRDVYIHSHLPLCLIYNLLLLLNTHNYLQIQRYSYISALLILLISFLLSA